MVTPKHSDFRGERCGAQARRRVSVFKGSFLCLEKNCWPGPTGLLSLPHRTPQHPRFFEGEKMIFKPSNMLLASFFASNFLDENKSRQQREFVFGSSISPPEKARIFSYKKMYSNISLLSTWVALAGNRHKTPRDSSSTAKRHLFRSQKCLRCSP